MTLGEMIQSVRDLASIKGEFASDLEKGPIRVATNMALKHICRTLRVPRFCFHGDLQPKRAGYTLDMNVAVVTSVKVMYEKKDYWLTEKDIDLVVTASAHYDVPALAPDAEYVTEDEATGPSGIRYYAVELRGKSPTNPEGAVILWIRPTSNQLVTEGLWAFGIKSIGSLSNDAENIPLPDVYLDVIIYWALWLLTDNQKWLLSYKETLKTTVNYAWDFGDQARPEKAI